MNVESWVSGVRRELWDDTALAYSQWDAAGTPIRSIPYSALAANDPAYPNAQGASARIAAATATANLAALQAKAQAALDNNATFLALASPTNAQTVTQVQKLTRQNDALIRVVNGLLASISDS